MDNWNEVKEVLKQALEDGEIPIDGRKMGAKAVYDQYKDQDAFTNVQFDNTFKTHLGDLRKEIRAGTAAAAPTPAPKKKAQKKKEAPKIDWANSAAKVLLKKLFREGTIPVDYDDPELIWTTHCEGKPQFTGMSYDANFRSRLKAVKEDLCMKKSRAIADQEAYDNFRRNHPRPTHNARGEPIWDGSQAQALLKEDMADGLHVGKEPKQVWLSRPEFQEFLLDVFRDHIYQEQRLWKLENFLKAKADKQKKKQDKQQQAQIDHLQYVRAQEALHNRQDTTSS